MSKSPKKLFLDPSRCKSCGLCIEVCPRHCLDVSQYRNRAGYLAVECVIPDQCIACGLCVLTCPEPLCLRLEELSSSD